MSLRPLRACRVPGCPATVDSGFCPAHGGAAASGPWATPSSAAGSRLRGRKWMALRLSVLSHEPTCYLCHAFAHHDDIVDHLIPLAGGGSDDRENLHRCCRPCHRLKTSRESQASRTGASR